LPALPVRLLPTSRLFVILTFCFACDTLMLQKEGAGAVI
jgi:hypothetical protein